MKDHLSQDQKARWLLGQIRPEEEAHRKTCPQCDSELRHFRDTMTTFQDVMKHWSEREGVWRPEDSAEILSWQPKRSSLKGRFALATAGVALVVLFAAYPRVDVERSEPQEKPGTVEVNDDVLLMEAVATHLSRPLPAPMERVLALLPSEEAALEINEREELR